MTQHIQTRHLSDISLQHYCYIIQFGVMPCSWVGSYQHYAEKYCFHTLIPLDRKWRQVVSLICIELCCIRQWSSINYLYFDLSRTYHCISGHLTKYHKSCFWWYWLPDCMEHSPYSKTNNFSGIQDIRHVLRNLKVHYSPWPVVALMPPPHSIKIHFNIFLLFMPRFSNGLLPSCFVANTWHAFLFSPMHAKSPTHLILKILVSTN